MRPDGATLDLFRQKLFATSMVLDGPASGDVRYSVVAASNPDEALLRFAGRHGVRAASLAHVDEFDVRCPIASGLLSSALKERIERLASDRVGCSESSFELHLEMRSLP